jgi:predicted nucleic acid-binding protein
MRFLVDNSVLQRLARSAEIRAAIGELADRGGMLCASTVSVLEAGFSVRSHSAHREIVRHMTRSFELLPLIEEVGAVAVELQDALWRAGMGRAAGVVDLLHAATAVANDAIVLHYDPDFDHLADVDRRVRARWIVSPGSVP